MSRTERREAMRWIKRIGEIKGWKLLGVIRLYAASLDGPGVRCWCPITALAHGETSSQLPTWLYTSAARDIGMPPKIAELISDAADYPDAPLRPALLKACGLKEAA